MSDTAAPAPRARVRRQPRRASYEREVVHAIVDEALICHVGFAHAGQPVVIPTIHWRDGDDLLVHGAPASRLLRQLSTGIPVCVTVTLVDGLVLARSAFHHSMNYRSAVLFGTAREVTEPGEKRAALDAFVARISPERAAEVRPPSEKELRSTSVLRVAVEDASAKARSGPPVDDDDDLALPVWAGVVPLALTRGAPLRHTPT